MGGFVLSWIFFLVLFPLFLPAVSSGLSPRLLSADPGGLCDSFPSLLADAVLSEMVPPVLNCSRFASVSFNHVHLCGFANPPKI